MKKLIQKGWKVRQGESANGATVYYSTKRRPLLLHVGHDGTIVGSAPGYNASFERDEAAAIKWALEQERLQ